MVNITDPVRASARDSYDSALDENLCTSTSIAADATSDAVKPHSDSESMLGRFTVGAHDDHALASHVVAKVQRAVPSIFINVRIVHDFASRRLVRAFVKGERYGRDGRHRKSCMGARTPFLKRHGEIDALARVEPGDQGPISGDWVRGVTRTRVRMRLPKQLNREVSAGHI
jgi:hypothetical protein